MSIGGRGSSIRVHEKTVHAARPDVVEDKGHVSFAPLRAHEKNVRLTSCSGPGGAPAIRPDTATRSPASTFSAACDGGTNVAL
jgi:hypothetical protein